MFLLEAPGAKALLFRAICAYMDAYRVLLTHDDFYAICKPTPVKQVVVAANVILRNICRAWTMYLCMDSVKFLLEAPGASISGSATILWQLADPFGGAYIC